MATIKINPAKLPYRGEPTKDRRPKPAEIPEGVKIVKVGNNSLETEHDAWRKKHIKHVERSNRNRGDKWTPEQEETALRLYWQGIDYLDIAKEVNRTEEAVRNHVNALRRRQGLRPRPQPRNVQNYNNAWQINEDEILIKMWNDGASAKEISGKLPGRSAGAIYARSEYLRENMNVRLEKRKRRP